MHRFKKMKFVSLLVALMMALSLIPLVAPQVASAAPSFSSLSSLSSMYFYLAQDTAGMSKVNSDLAALQSLIPTTGLEDQLFASTSLLLPLPSTSTVTEAAATQFLIDLEKIKYSPDAGTAIANAGTFYLNDATTEGSLLPGVTVVDFIDFATTVQTTGLESALSSTSNYQTVMGSSQSSPLLSDFISTALTSAMSSSADTAMINAVSANPGWSFGNIAAAEMLIDSQVDPTYLGETALFKAYVNSDTPITSSSTPVAITVPAGGSGSFDLSSLLGGATTAMPAITINSTVDGATSTVTFQQGTTTTVTGGTWDGIISLPTVVTPPASELPANINASSVVAISMGPDNNVTLTFSKPVSILVPGQTGKSVGYIKNGAFTQITNKLTSNALPSGVIDGYYDDGVNITIWTTHFTTFLTYTASAVSGGGGAVSVVPAVTSVSPGTGSTAGGTTVTINGTNLTGATAVKFGAVAATSFTVNSNGTITAISPAGTAGTVDVSVTTPNGASSVNPPADQFTYTVPAPTPVKGAIFTDVPNSFWAYGDIGNLSGLGYVSGYPDGTFKPNNQITRAEFCAIMDKALNLTNYTQQTPTLTDVSSGDWFYGSVESAVYAGIVKGYGDGTFQPNAPISRQEIACVLVQAMGKAGVAQAMMNAQTIFTDDASIAAWARGFVAEANQAGLIKGYPDGSFAPKTGATRAEACVMISNLLVLQSKS